MACKHERVMMTLETSARPVWSAGPGWAQHHEELSEETWMGGVTYDCPDCGKHGRYTGSQIPKWLMARIDSLPIWPRVKRGFGAGLGLVGAPGREG